jgi:hypothetical protein
MSETNKAEQWTGQYITPGRKDDKSAFRSEIGGFYYMAVAIKLLSKFFHISNGSVSFGSDCEAAVYYIFDRNKKATATTNYFDLIMATRKSWTDSLSASHTTMFLRTKISQGNKWIYGGEQTTTAIHMLRPSGKKKRQQAH